MGLGGCFVVCVYMAAFGLSQVRTLHHAKHQVNITIAGTVASATTKQIDLPATSGRSTNQMVLVTPMVMRQMPRGRKMQTCLHRQLLVGTMLRQKMRVAHGVLQRVCLHLPYMQKLIVHNFTHQQRLPFRVYRLQFMSAQDQTRLITPSSACCCRKNKDTSTSFNPGSCVWRRNGFERSTATIFTLAGPEPMKV